ncbi:MAG: hypothetical protein QOD92_281 [Acidimicrobiaceae bacterium]
MSEKASSAGEQFARALGTKDAAALRQILHPDLDFRAMTPGRFWEASDVDTVIDEVLLGKWFEPTDDVREIVSVETGDDVGAVHRVGYRFNVTNADGDFAVEQQAYYNVDDSGQISWLRVMCCGFVPSA